MAASKFNPETRAGLIESFAAGLSVRDTARVAGLNEKTLKSWLTRGRREDAGEYADFVARVEEAREAARNRPEPVDAEELAIHVSEAVRAGSVPAMKLRWEMLNGKKVVSVGEMAEEPDPLSGMDELANRRARRRA